MSDTPLIETQIMEKALLIKELIVRENSPNVSKDKEDVINIWGEINDLIKAYTNDTDIRDALFNYARKFI